MAKKLLKKRRLKLTRLILLLIIIALIFITISSYLDTNIKNILVYNNTYLDEQTILELAGVDDYPSFYWTSSSSIKRRLLASPYIKDVKINKKFYHVLEIDITEYKILFQKESDGKIVLENKKELLADDMILEVPRLMNYIPDNKYNQFIKGMIEMTDDIRSKVSEIQYSPNEFDKDRFLLYMSDGNSVYLTLTKFDMINRYSEVLPQLEGRKGILYLDSGNHFEIRE